MTFNILHSSVRSPAGPWSLRRPLVARTIRTERPDIACLQEVSERQLADLSRDLPEYEFVAGEPSGAATFPMPMIAAAAALGAAWFALRRRAGRRGGVRTLGRALEIASGAGAMLAIVAVLIARFILGDYLESGERCPILARRDRIACRERGCFWLSSRPDRPGSTLPGSFTPHAVTWTRVEELGAGRSAIVYDTHLGVTPWSASAMAKVLHARLDQDWNGEPQVLAGDFNSAPGGPLVHALLAPRNGGPPALHDTWVEAARRSGTGRTFQLGVGLAGPRIDYILVRPPLRVTSAATVPARFGRRFASDHDAVVVELEPARPGSR